MSSPITSVDLGVSARCDGEHATTQPQFQDRKSTRLNSSHGYISYAVFCLKKKKKEVHSCMPNLLAAAINRKRRSKIPHLSVESTLSGVVRTDMRLLGCRVVRSARCCVSI